MAAGFKTYIFPFGFAAPEAAFVAIYTASLNANPSPTKNRLANITPAVDVNANPSPDKELLSG